MNDILENPFIVFAVSLVAQWLAAYIGDFARRRARPLRESEQKDLDTVKTAILTLLALIIGFSFSMAVTRYDQRKNFEEAEANAIGTEYARADLLPTENAAHVHELLRRYVDRRIAFYLIRDPPQLSEVDAETAKLQADLWSAVLSATNTQPTPAMALVISGMNDVLNSQGYTRASWWNRIPGAAWGMMGLIAICCNLLLGFGERGKSALMPLVLPVIVSISFFLIADIDSPRGGVILVYPQNLTALSHSIEAP